MRHTRSVGKTLRIVLVTACAALGALATRAEDPAAPDPDAADRALRRILLETDPLPERLALAARALEAGPPTDVASAVEAALALADPAPRTALWLLVQARDGAFLTDALQARAREAFAARLAEAGADDVQGRARWAAAAFLLGARDAATREALLAAWPPEPGVRAVLDREVVLPAPTRRSLLEAPRPDALAEALALLAPVLEGLDAAERDDPAASMAGMDALLALGGRAVVPLMETVRPALDGPGGRRPRAVRAAAVLGLLGDRRATPMLLAALGAPDGWLRVAAATALGDLGDPAAVRGLCRQLFYRGDVLRPRDQWDYPGAQQTTVSREDWASVPYYATDVAAADALLRLGLPGATGYLIHQKLDPARARFRIRVLQDAVDALERAWGEAVPIDGYNVDAGVDPRMEAFSRLVAWWASDPSRDAFAFAPLDETDPGWRREARRLVETLRGRSIMELQIAQESAALIGAPLTPTLLETLAATDNRVLRVEIARALGAVADPRAVPALLALLAGDVEMVRATAAESLGAYVDGRGPEGARARRALLAALDDATPALRVAAMKGLVRAAPAEDVARAVAAHGHAAFRADFGLEDGELERAETVVRFVQEGEQHWKAIHEGLVDEQRYVRTAWWDLLRRALSLRPTLYDAVAVPHQGDWREPDAQAVLEALAERRGS